VAIAKVIDMQQRGRGAPVTPADIGPMTARLARTVETVPSAGSRELTEQLAERQAGSPGRIIAGIENIVSPGDQKATIKALDTQRKAGAAPWYQKAFAHPIPPDEPRIARLLEEPVIQKGIQKGLRSARIESAKLLQPWAPPEPSETMRILDAAKRGLDEILEKKRDKITMRLPSTESVKEIVGLNETLKNTLDELNPFYARARSEWAGPSQSMKAVRSGRAFMRGDLEDIDVPKADRKNFLVGLVREARKMIGSGVSDTADVSKRLLKPAVRERLEALLEPPEFAELMDVLNVERTMGKTFNATSGGSITIRGLAEQADTGEQTAAGFITDMATGSPTSAIAGLARSQANRVGKGLNEPTADELAKMLRVSNPVALRVLGERLRQSHIDELARRAGTRGLGTLGLFGGLSAGIGQLERGR
jgi:hypothetical protein